MITNPEQELAQRLRTATMAAFDLASVALGARLGLYVALRDLGNANPAELAASAGTDVRYTREWLEHQAVSGLIAVWEQSASPDGRRYALIPGTLNLLTDQHGADRTVHDVRSAVSSILLSDRVAASFRDGTGIPFSAYGAEMRESQALGNRLEFDRFLGTTWMPAAPELHQRLLHIPSARIIADIGFGAGWSSIALARLYPDAQIDGLDLDPASVDLARENAKAEGLQDRISFQIRDAADPALSGRYDLAFAFECIHDMAQPVPVLRAMRSLLSEGGSVLVGEDLVDDTFSAPGSDSERITYGYSLFHCLPVGREGAHAVGTGALMRDSIFRSYCATAGFGIVNRLPVEESGWRMYQLLV